MVEVMLMNYPVSALPWEDAILEVSTNHYLSELRVQKLGFSSFSNDHVTSTNLVCAVFQVPINGVLGARTSGYADGAH